MVFFIYDTISLTNYSKDIDHCGIVAGIIDSMCLVEQINQILGTHPQEIVTPGQAVKAMILNGLGLVSAPLYLFEKFRTYTTGTARSHLYSIYVLKGKWRTQRALLKLVVRLVFAVLIANRQYHQQFSSPHLPDFQLCGVVLSRNQKF